MTEQPYAEYSEDLRDALELRGVPDEAVTQIVREVESHVAESGEDPASAFGQPADYADNFAPRSQLVRFWALLISVVVLAGGGTYVLISGVFGLLSPSAALWGLPPWFCIFLGAAGITAFFVLQLVAGARSKRSASSWRLPAGEG
ncbi:hypothetical protein ACFFON_18465 [Arthrobacter citreus]|uniref:hypothetical protein n=1 Tax=Arthrobacter TaxID=1663 RepID=UPI001264254C|nr:hypothetical protein [Arthrobacter gandavensis]